MPKELSEGMKAIIKDIARQVAEDYLDITTKMIGEEIRNHANECKIGRLSSRQATFIAVLSSVCTVVGAWLIGKL